jgi:hypothetical protein
VSSALHATVAASAAVGTGVDWFPQQYADAFDVVKGVLAITAVVILVVHMNVVWGHELLSPARRARYIALLVGAMTVAYASGEQIRQGAVVNYRNLGGLLFVVVTFVAAVLSVWEARRRR